MKFLNKIKAKYLLSVVALLCAATVIAQNKTITVSGSVKFNAPEFKMQIIKQDGPVKKVMAEFDIDSNNEFNYKFEVAEPGVYTLDCKKWESINFWGEDENIHVNFRGADTAKIKIKNPPYHMIEKSGPKNEVLNHLNYLVYSNYQGMIALNRMVYEIQYKADSLRQLAAMAVYNYLNSDYSSKIANLADLYYDRTSAVALLNYMNPEKEEARINKIINSIYDKHPNYKPISDYIEKQKRDNANRERVKIGSTAPEFSYPTPDGKKMLGPDSFRGKILLIDFWASWCGPCRAEIPNLKSAYEKYKERGVEFFSVSIDKGTKEWIKALESEQMPWPQVLAPESGKETMELYQFSGIPFIILLDSEGRIVAKNLRGEALEKAIEKQLSQNK